MLKGFSIGAMMKLIIFTILLFSIAHANMCLENYSLHHKEARIHQEITETLYIGVPIKFKPFSANQNKNSLWIVTVKNPKTGQILEALFKPRFPGDGDGWNRPPMEYVSYEVNRLLGMDIIPPVAYRYNLSLGSQFFHEGSLQYFVKGASLLKEQPLAQWNVSTAEFISDARILDILLQNPDRHEGNFIFGPHWSELSKKPMLIDQAANMRKGTNMRLSTKGPFNSEIITFFNKQTIYNLRLLTSAKLATLKPFITDEEIARILHHKEGLLSYYDSK